MPLADLDGRHDDQNEVHDAENPQQNEADQREDQNGEQQAEKQHGNLKIERLLRLARDERHGLALGAPDDQRPEHGEQHQSAERNEQQPRAARKPQQAAQMRRHRPVPLFAAEFVIHDESSLEDVTGRTCTARLPSL